MKKYTATLSLARAIEKQVHPTVTKQSIHIVLSLIAAVRCFLAARHHASVIRSTGETY